MTAGKPGMHLAPSRSGFPRSPLPALCRQDTSCARRSGPRKVPDRRSGWSLGRAEARSRGSPRATLAAQTVTIRSRSGVRGWRWRPGWPKGGPEAQRNRTATRAKRYAQCGLGGMCAKRDTKQSIFWTSNQDAKFRPETERPRRYAQCGFVGMGALKRSMLRRVRCVFCNVAEMTSSGANAKSIGNI